MKRNFYYPINYQRLFMVSILCVIIFLIFSDKGIAQDFSLIEVDKQVDTATTSVKKWIKNILTIAFGLVAIYTVYQVGGNKPHARESVIAFIVALVLAAIAWIFLQ